MSNTSHVFSLEALQAQVAAEAAEPAAAPTPAHPAATPAQLSSTSTAAPAATPTPGVAPTASDDGRDGYVDLDAWRMDDGEPTPQQPAAAGDETRYRVLKGKYDAEVPRLQARVRELEAQTAPQDAGTLRQLQTRIETLTSELESLRSTRSTQAPAAAPGAANGAGTDDLPDLDDDLAFEYGEAGARVIRDLRTQVSTLQQQTDARIGSIEARDAKRARESFRNQLVDRLGEDRSVFDEPGWAEFVQQRNPYVAGKNYNASLIDADAAGDLDTIVNIVKAYRQSGDTAGAETRLDPFDALAVPARVQATGTPVAGQRFRGGDLDAMVKKWQRGEKTFSELQAFERAFTAAQQSGRVDT